MTSRGVMCFVVQSVYELFEVMEHIKKNVVKTPKGMFINSDIYKLPERQVYYRKRNGVPCYE